MSIFGTDGVRGTANKDLTPELALNLGKAGGCFLSEQAGGTVVMGKDTRLSGDMIEGALVAGLTSVGLNVHLAGIIPTPGIAYLARTGEYCGGVMISASHNPIGDNGIKFFNHQGFKLSDAEEDAIEGLIKEGHFPTPTGTKIGRVDLCSDLKEQYITHLVATVAVDLSGLRVALDPAFGAAWEVAPRVWERLGSKVVAINARPAGEKINKGCGSTAPAVLCRFVQQEGAHIGFAYDGDADRVLAVDERGRILDGDFIMAICGTHLLAENRLKGHTVVTTAYSNQGLKECFHKAGGHVHTTKNGDRYVLQAMLKKNLCLGGEKSGHIIFLDNATTGDGILTSLQLAQVLIETGKPLSVLAERMRSWPQMLENVKVRSKAWQKNKAIKEVVAEIEATMGDQGRLFVRASGTEPVVRVMLEGRKGDALKPLMEKIVLVLRKELE